MSPNYDGQSPNHDGLPDSNHGDGYRKHQHQPSIPSAKGPPSVDRRMSARNRPMVTVDETATKPPVDEPYEITLQRVDVGQHERTATQATPPTSLESTTTKKKSSSGPDPITQSLGLLATMAVMLLIARFAVPTIVEEVRYAWHRGELRAEYEMGTEGLKNVSLDALSDAYGMVTAAVGPSVVHIDVKRRQSLQALLGEGAIAKEHFPASSDQGSGIIVDSEGYILTNSHVVSGGEDITVTLSDGRRKTAIVIGIDPLTDLAVLKVEASDLIAIGWGDSDACKVGSPVWAVGSPFGLDRTVTFGIISGKHRKVRSSTEWQDFMQSDVAVNPGNSGGPLVDARGTLIGVNTAIVGDTYQGVSFSVPSNTAKKIYERLRAAGRVQRGWLGVSLANVSDEQLVGKNPRIRGAMVGFLPDPNAPAAVAGVQTRDLITHVDGVAVRDTQHLMQLIGEAVPGQTIDLRIHRQGEFINLLVTLGSRPETTLR